MNKLQFDALRQAIGRILGVSNFKDLPAGFRATNAWQALQGAIVEAGEVFSEGAEVLEPEMIQSLQTQSRRAIAAYWLAENTIETISKATEKVKKDFNPAAQSE